MNNSSRDNFQPFSNTAWALSLGLLAIHCYAYGHLIFRHWGLTNGIADRIVSNFLRMPLFCHYASFKTAVLVAGVTALTGAKAGRSAIPLPTAIASAAAGLMMYFFPVALLRLDAFVLIRYTVYLVMTILGYGLTLFGISVVMRRLTANSQRSVFNSFNETFPQEERLIENEFSINLPATYILRGKKRTSWINIINPFRGLLILGTPGSGKTFFIIQQIIRQHIGKGFAMFIYDFKYPDLTNIAWHYYLELQHAYSVKPGFYVIDFENICHRCNPIEPDSMADITDAAESARTILLGLNPAWIKKQGDFWVESSVNFLTALLWWLRLCQDGRYCTLAHVIELIQTPYDKLFSILRLEPQVEALILPFITAYENNASAQLEGQVAGVTISLSKLSSPNLYYVLTGNDFTLNINDPDSPSIVCVGNRPQKSHIYGAVLSLYLTALMRHLNKKGRHKSSVVVDELPSIYCHGIDNLLATARSNQVAATLAVQDASQLKVHYGKEQAEVILGITGNIIAGQVSGETARQLAERFGKILQDKESISVRGNDRSVTASTQLEMAIPASTISSLSSGEFVGLVADDPYQRIALKKFHAAFHTGKQIPLTPLPIVEKSREVVLENYVTVKKEVRVLVEKQLEILVNNPAMKHLLVQKKDNRKDDYRDE